MTMPSDQNGPTEAASKRYPNATYQLPPGRGTVVLELDCSHHRETDNHRNSHGPKVNPHR
jgi:hypothetical protein